MSDEKAPLVERVANYYSQLSTVAADLNAVSDELGKSITQIDVALKKLNLGVIVWVPVRRDDGSPNPYETWYWSEDIGYAKIGGNWGISLRKVAGDYDRQEEEQVESWLFNDAPRAMRLSSIEKIPELLKKLSEEAVRTTKDIRARLGEAKAVAEAVKVAANGTMRIPARVPINDSGPKIDLTRVSKPGDVLKAILAKKQIEQDNVPAAPVVSAAFEPNLYSVRDAVSSALVEAGHLSAAQLLGGGHWTLDGASLRIEVAGMGKKMLALNVNAAAEKIIRQELLRTGAPSRFMVVPVEGIVLNAPIAGSSTEVK